MSKIDYEYFTGFELGSIEFALEEQIKELKSYGFHSSFLTIKGLKKINEDSIKVAESALKKIKNWTKNELN